MRRRRAGLRGAGLHQRGPPPPIHARAWAGPPAAIDAGRPDRYTGRLTVPLASRYKAALVAVLATVPALALPDVRVAGAILPDGAEKVAENRYRVPRSYEDTVKFFKQTYGARYTRRPIADQPVQPRGSRLRPHGHVGHGLTQVYALLDPQGVGVERVPEGGSVVAGLRRGRPGKQGNGDQRPHATGGLPRGRRCSRP